MKGAGKAGGEGKEAKECLLSPAGSSGLPSASELCPLRARDLDI